VQLNDDQNIFFPCKLSTKFGEPNIGLGDAITPPIEELEGANWLDFCGVPPAKFEAICLEQQFAEKMHAMTVDRGERENSRVKDLVDVLLLIKKGLNKKRIAEALTNTFRRRGESTVSSHLTPLPDSWRQPFMQMAIECDLHSDFDAALNTLATHVLARNTRRMIDARPEKPLES
jgi:hypothetical protein